MGGDRAYIAYYTRFFVLFLLLKYDTIPVPVKRVWKRRRMSCLPVIARCTPAAAMTPTAAAARAQ